MALIVLCAASSHAQLAAYHDRGVGNSTVISGGQYYPVLVPIQYGQVRVCNTPASGSPCTPVAQIYDMNGNALPTSLGSNFGQLTTDVTGQFSFQCTTGEYEVQVAPSSSNTPQLNYLVACPNLMPGGSSTVYEVNGTALISSSAINFTAAGSPPGFTWAVSNPSAGIVQYSLTAATGITQDEFLGSPCGSTGSLALRVLCSGDIPNNNANTGGSAASLSGSLTQCPAGQAPTGITSTGAANGCATTGGSLAKLSLPGQTNSEGGTLCLIATCGAGEFLVTAVLENAAVCSLSGPAAISISVGYTDPNAAQTIEIPLASAGSYATSISLGHALASSTPGVGVIPIHSTGAANITYTASLTGCTTGTATYNLLMSVQQVQ
jgi:hypothetical protein